LKNPIPRFSKSKPNLVRINVTVINCGGSLCSIQYVQPDSMTISTPIIKGEARALSAMRASIQRTTGIGRVSLIIQSRSLAPNR
jgi:hypothetical protein